jgi:hypothetical protein
MLSEAGYEIRDFSPLVDAESAGAAPGALDRLINPSVRTSARFVFTAWLPYICLRAFLKDAENEYATVDVYYWFGNQMSALASRIRFMAGARSASRDPLARDNTAATWYEADHARTEAGLLCPDIARVADGSLLALLPTLGAQYVTAYASSMGTASRILVGAMPVEHNFSLLRRSPQESVAPTESTSPTAGDLDIAYTWPDDMRYGRVHNDPDNSGVVLRVKWQGAAVASASNWDDVLQPGDVAVSPPGMSFYGVQILATGACTLGTDFSVKAWV